MYPSVPVVANVTFFGRTNNRPQLNKRTAESLDNPSHADSSNYALPQNICI